MTDRAVGGFIGDVVAARDVLSARRRAARTVGWGQLVQDWYIALFTTASLLTMLFAATGPGGPGAVASG